MNQIRVYSDGGSRGNPGPAATGFEIYDPHNNLLESGGKYIGLATNNQAEYQAILQALLSVIQKKIPSQYPQAPITCYLDSLLVVNQLHGIYKIKKPHLQSLADKIISLIRTHRISVSFSHIPRDQNHRADAIVNRILDSQSA